MVVDEDRSDGAVGGLVLVEAFVAFDRAPAVVDSLAGVEAIRRRRVVDLLEVALADVGDPEITRGRRTRIATGCAAVRPDRRVGAGRADERVVGRDRERLIAGGERVDPQDLAESRTEVECEALRVAAGPTVAEADVQELIRPNASLPPLWFVYGWSTVRTSRNDAASKRPVDGSIANSATTVLPEPSM